jgi:hypothetical protein
MKYEYKTVGAPEKGKRKRGLRSQSDRVAAAFEEILQDEAVDGWEYQRTDLLPVMESAGWFKRGHEVHRAVMVFRRPLDPAQQESEVILRRAPSVTPPVAPAPLPTPARAPAPEPEISADPDLRIAEMVRGPGGPKPES